MVNLNSSRILISGGCSFVGKYLVNYLLRNTNSQLIVCCRTIPEVTLKESRVVYETADLIRPESYQKVFEKHKPLIVFHLAAITRLSPGEENPELTVRTNYFGTKLIADLCVDYKVKSFLSVSSNLARNPKSVVGLLKYLSEVYLRKCGDLQTKMISIRLPNVPGSPGSVTNIFDKQIEAGGHVTVTDPLMERRFVTNEEASNLLTTAIEIGENSDVFVVPIENTKITNLAAEMISNSGKQIEIKYIGIKPSEKLIEEKYEEKEIMKTEIETLSILKDDWNEESINQALRILGTKNDVESFRALVEKIKVSLHD